MRCSRTIRNLRSHLPHIAIRNSTTDALAAVIEYLADKDDRSQLGKLLQALEYNLLERFDEPGGEIVLDQKILLSWFSPIGGETSWEVIASRNVPDPANQNLPANQPPMDASMISDILLKANPGGRLEQLNRVQSALDAIQMRPSRALRDFYGLRWNAGNSKETQT